MNIYIQCNENKFFKFYLNLKLDVKRKIFIDIIIFKYVFRYFKIIFNYIYDKLEVFNNLYKLIIII